jgi:trehalose-phosphatase
VYQYPFGHLLKREENQVIDDAGLPDGLEHVSAIKAVFGRRRPAFFLDFDGTLAPIASTPGSAAMPAHVRELLAGLATSNLVCIASGRGLTDLRSKVNLHTIYYAADHGHHIVGPEGTGIELEVAPDDSLELEAASYELERRLRDITGAIVETKGVSLSVHYRLVAEAGHALVEQSVREVAANSPGLRLTTGKLVFELTPDLGWDKGRAILWLINRLGLKRSSVCPVCLGDDRTDEDMFRVARGWGISLAVGEAAPQTHADYRLRGLDEVSAFLEQFVGDTPSMASPG